MNEEQIRGSTWEDGTWKEENPHGGGAPSEGGTNGERTKKTMAAKEIKLTPEQEARFWLKVDKSIRPDGCWIWTAGKFQNGYGSFRVRLKCFKAHRIAWMVARGSITLGLCVCHSCDNRICVNPMHLFLGSDADNARDRERKGRGNQAKGDSHGSRTHPESRPRGEDHWKSKLTAANVIEIRALYASGGTSQRQLASQFGIDRSVIYRIIHRKKWKHV